jgi:hypothetical protein
MAQLGYAIPAGHAYVATDLVAADYYDRDDLQRPSAYTVFTSDEKFYVISFNHRLAFVRAMDVDTVR